MKCLFEMPDFSIHHIGGQRNPRKYMAHYLLIQGEQNHEEASIFTCSFAVVVDSRSGAIEQRRFESDIVPVRSSGHRRRSQYR